MTAALLTPAGNDNSLSSPDINGRSAALQADSLSRPDWCRHLPRGVRQVRQWLSPEAGYRIDEHLGQRASGGLMRISHTESS